MKDNIFLIVDDEPDLCWVLENILKEKGYLFKKATNGYEALSLMKSYRFRLVFLDAKLSDIDGLDLARRIKEIDPDIFVVMVTGYFYMDDIAVEKAMAQGLISWFISKPFLHQEIIKAVSIANYQ